jgi:hypothetical protein
MEFRQEAERFCMMEPANLPKRAHRLPTGSREQPLEENRDARAPTSISNCFVDCRGLLIDRYSVIASQRSRKSELLDNTPTSRDGDRGTYP